MFSPIYILYNQRTVEAYNVTSEKETF